MIDDISKSIDTLGIDGKKGKDLDQCKEKDDGCWNEVPQREKRKNGTD